MKLILHGINYAPELTGVGKYTGELGAWLAARGHEVRVVTAPPYYPQWRVEPPHSARRYQVETLAGVRVYRTPLYVPAAPSGLKRVVHLVSFALASLPVMLAQIAWRPDVVIVFEPTFTAVPQAWLTARLCGAKAVLHVQDFEVDAAFRLGLVGGGTSLVARLAQALEGWWMRRFDRVSSISGQMVARLTEKGVPAERCLRFDNWADLAPFRAAAAAPRRLPALPAGKRIVLYSGNLGEKQGLDDVLVVAERTAARLPDVQYVLCGDGAARARLAAEAARRGLTNVTFLPLQSNDDFPHLLAGADVHLVVQRRGAADLVMPSKLIAILAVGGAAVVTAEPGTELHAVVAGQGVGDVVAPEDPLALAAAVERLLGDTAARRAYGQKAAAYAEERFEKERILRAFEAELVRVVG